MLQRETLRNFFSQLRMRTPFSFMGATALSITVAVNWGTGSCSSAGGCSVTSSTETMTVPAGSPGTIKLADDAGGGATPSWSKNGGGNTSWTGGGTTTVSVVTNDTITLRLTGIGAGPSTQTITVTDNTTNAAIGTFAGTNTHA